MYNVKKHIGIRIFFLALFLSYFADITFFTHYHIIHGVTIVHSHFTFEKNTSKPDKPAAHNHSNNALTLISNAASWLTTLQDTPILPDNLLVAIVSYFPGQTCSPTQFAFHTLKPRGPPAIA